MGGCCQQSAQFMPDGTPVTPLPKKKIMALVICSMTWGFQMNIIFVSCQAARPSLLQCLTAYASWPASPHSNDFLAFLSQPFMPFMVDWMRGTAEDSGMYVGILASSYFWGQFIASFIWPPLSDRIGRKKSLIWGQLALTLPFIGFAFSRSYWAAVGWRFLNGVLQSNSPITKAYIADICDRTNSAAGMSVMAFSWGMANVIAPTVGGLLAEPCIAYPAYFPVGSWQHQMFSHETGSPYALPSLFVFVFGFVVAIPMVIIWLPETSPVTLCDVLHGRCSRDKAAYTHLEEEIDDDKKEEHVHDSTPVKSVTAASDDVEEEDVVVPIPTYWEMVTARDSGTALGTLALLCPSWITYQEMFPLFCKAKPEQGGIGFTAYQIGTAMTISGVVMVIYQPLVFPKLQRHFGNVRCYRYGSMSFNILLLVFPFSHFLWDQEHLLWAWICFQRVWEVATATAMWMPSFIMIMNTALPEYQGRMQGLAGE